MASRENGLCKSACELVELGQRGNSLEDPRITLLWDCLKRIESALTFITDHRDYKAESTRDLGYRVAKCLNAAGRYTEVLVAHEAELDPHEVEAQMFHLQSELARIRT